MKWPLENSCLSWSLPRLFKGKRHNSLHNYCSVVTNTCICWKLIGVLSLCSGLWPVSLSFLDRWVKILYITNVLSEWHTLYQTVHFWHLVQMVRGISSGARVFEYLVLKPTITGSGGGRISYHNLMGRVDFVDISFRLGPRLISSIVDIVWTLTSDDNVYWFLFFIYIFIVTQQDPVIRFWRSSVWHFLRVKLLPLLENPEEVTYSYTYSNCNCVICLMMSPHLSIRCILGKSTVASLLERFYDPTSGVVKVDGVDIKTLDLSWLRGQVIGFINQVKVAHHECVPFFFKNRYMNNILFHIILY